MKELTSIALTDNQKRVLSKIIASPTPTIAGSELLGDQNLIAARNQLAKLGAIQYVGDEASLTDVGERLAKEYTLIDETGALSQDGQMYAQMGDEEKQQPAQPVTVPPNVASDETLTMSHIPSYEPLAFLREVLEHTKYSVGDKVETLVGGRWIPATITKPPHKETGNYGVRFKVGKKVMNYVSSPNQLRRPKD